MDKPFVEICRIDFGLPGEKEEEIIKEALKMKNIAIVGLSPKKDRPSYDVAEYLQRMGYNIIPVRPGIREILGKRCYRSLDEVEEPVDVVNVFRRPEYCPGIAKKAVEVGAKILWLQEGIVSEEAKKIAEAAGLSVVMNFCIKKAHRKYMQKRDVWINSL